MFIRQGIVVVVVMIASSVLGISLGTEKADAIVSPTGLAGGLGNSNNIEPFNPFDPSRMQQVYASSDFSGMGGRNISTRSPSGRISSVRLSRTSRSRCPPRERRSMEAQPHFREQHWRGCPDRLPRNSADLQHTVAQRLRTPAVRPGHQPAASLPLRPLKGNLLVDFTNPSPQNTVFVNPARPTLDAQEVLGD